MDTQKNAAISNIVEAGPSATDGEAGLATTRLRDSGSRTTHGGNTIQMGLSREAVHEQKRKYWLEH